MTAAVHEQPYGGLEPGEVRLLSDGAVVVGAFDATVVVQTDTCQWDRYSGEDISKGIEVFSEDKVRERVLAALQPAGGRMGQDVQEWMNWWAERTAERISQLINPTLQDIVPILQEGAEAVASQVQAIYSDTLDELC